MIKKFTLKKMSKKQSNKKKSRIFHIEINKKNLMNLQFSSMVKKEK